MSVFEKVQESLMQIKVNIACCVRREQAIIDENKKSLIVSKREIEAMLDSTRRSDIIPNIKQ